MSETSPGDTNSFAHWQERVKGTNISSVTLLATDYLNHFNEIIMLLGMIPDMPEILDDCRAWAPKNYQDHFRDSSFSDKELAIAAYERVQPPVRQGFEHTITRMNELVLSSIEQISQTIAAGDADAVRLKSQDAAQSLQRYLEFASGIIHGSVGTMSQEEIDKLVAR
ncbi:MAG: hypothetical protein HY057_10095 [Rhodospirillales bacterium]|nr:hypothetical protein [Rhodospirillales bacterium]